MDDLKTRLEAAIYQAEYECKAKYGCRNGADCYKCELLKTSCVKGYVVDRLLERFNISAKEGAEE